MSSRLSKRVRTGCQRCRVRRRKCDEEKPQCQRCIAAGCECRYGTRLSFIEKNAFTGPHPASSTEAPAVSTYRWVRVVGRSASLGGNLQETEGGALLAPAPAQHSDCVSAQSPAGALASPAQSSMAKNARESQQGQQPPSLSGDADSPRRDSEGQPLSQQSTGSTPPTAQIEVEGITGALAAGAATSDGFDIAMDSLLSLDANASADPAHKPVFLNKPASTTILRGEEIGLMLDHVEGLSVSAMSDDVVTCNGAVGPSGEEPDRDMRGLGDDTMFELLKHYRCQVAPWLDIYDLGQSFGVLVLCLATENAGLLECLVALAAASLSLLGDSTDAGTPHTRRSLSQLDTAPGRTLQVEAGVGLETQVLCYALNRTKSMINTSVGPPFPTSPESDIWQNLPASSGPLVASLNLMAPAYYLLLRQQLCMSLLSETPIAMLPLLPDQFPAITHASKLARSIFHSASEALVLCARAVNFWARDTSLPGAEAVQGVLGVWTSLFGELNSWYSRRTQDFCPMVEMEESGDEIPTILFNGGAGVFANQLYHTAMLLLLLRRPRTLKPAAAQQSTLTSPLWHARRVCGIALSNDRPECWDTSLVASLVTAARCMTHEAQHRAILECMSRVQKHTGWLLEGCRRLLMAEWGMTVLIDM